MGAPPREQGGSSRQRENGGFSALPGAPAHLTGAELSHAGARTGPLHPMSAGWLQTLGASAYLLPKRKRLGRGRLSFQQAFTVSVLSYPLSISLSGRCPLLVSRLYLGADQDLRFRGLHSLPRLWLLYLTISHVPWTEYLCPPRFICNLAAADSYADILTPNVMILGGD